MYIHVKDRLKKNYSALYFKLNRVLSPELDTSLRVMLFHLKEKKNWRAAATTTTTENHRKKQTSPQTKPWMHLRQNGGSV